MQTQRRIRSFVLRAGRTTAAQERALSELWPAYGIDLKETPLDLAAVFGREAPRCLEIGFGAGEVIAALAETLRDHVADAAFDEMLVFFPDPWHKKRHHKRRLIDASFAALAADKLRAGGILRLATDWQEYAEQMLAVCNANRALESLSRDLTYVPRPEFRPPTRFERRGERLGHGVWDLAYAKRVR